MDPLSGSRGLVAAIAGSLLVSCALFSEFVFGAALTGKEWAINFQYYDWINVAFSRYGTLPLFMYDAPHTQDLLANPQAPVLGPFAWLLRFVEAELYVKLLILFYSTCGTLGMLYLARDLGAGLPVALLCSVLFSFNGFMTAHLSVGHHMVLGLYLLPALLLFFRRAVHGQWLALWLAASTQVVVLLEGANHPFVWHSLFLGAYALFWSVQLRCLRPLWIGGLVVAAAAGLAAVKLVPMLAMFSGYEVNFNLARLSPLGALWSMTARGQSVDTEWPGIEFIRDSGWWEYDVYIGLLGISLLLVGIAAARRGWPMAATGGLFLVLTLQWPDWLAFLNVWEFWQAQ